MRITTEHFNDIPVLPWMYINQVRTFRDTGIAAFEIYITTDKPDQLLSPTEESLFCDITISHNRLDDFSVYHVWVGEYESKEDRRELDPTIQRYVRDELIPFFAIHKKELVEEALRNAWRGYASQKQDTRERLATIEKELKVISDALSRF